MVRAEVTFPRGVLNDGACRTSVCIVERWQKAVDKSGPNVFRRCHPVQQRQSTTGKNNVALSGSIYEVTFGYLLAGKDL